MPGQSQKTTTFQQVQKRVVSVDFVGARKKLKNFIRNLVSKTVSAMQAENELFSTHLDHVPVSPPTFLKTSWPLYGR